MAIVYKIDKELKDIVPAFMDARIKDKELLKNFFAEKNYEELKSIGHKVKGTSGSYEFMELSEIGEKIESSAGEKDDDSLAKLIQEYQEHVDQIEIEYV